MISQFQTLQVPVTRIVTARRTARAASTVSWKHFLLNWNNLIIILLLSLVLFPYKIGNVPTHQCMCHPSAYVDESCPTVGHRCTSCCCGKNVYCTGDICQLYEMAGVSSQMILSIVMVTGLVSIIFMVYRMCYRNTL